MNLSQTELGNRLEPSVNRAAVNKWESGTVENIKRTHIKQLANIFNVTPCDLMQFENDMSISYLYKQLNEANQKDVYEYAEMKLHKQEQMKIIDLPKTNKVDEDPTMVIAAHMDDNATEEEKQEVADYINQIRDRRNKDKR